MVTRAEPLVISPQAGPQTDFLSTPADICVYGGAAGGGKTYGLLLEPLRHVHNSLFRAVIFRRTSPMIENPGGLLDTSAEIYGRLGASINQRRLEWVFDEPQSKRGRIRFAHMQYENDKLSWQGAQITMEGWDELTHFTETQFFYLLSRSRSMSGIRPYVRATCNPDAESWVKEFLAPWVDDEYPGEHAGPGELRHMVRVSDEILWLTDREADEWYEDEDRPNPKTVTFIPATLADNPILNETDPEYRANLEALPLVERMRLLHSDWNIIAQAGTFFKQEWFDGKIIDAPPTDILQKIRYWDLAATKPTKSRKRPDRTAGVLMAKTTDNRIIVMHATAVEERPQEVESLLQQTAAMDGVGTPIKVEQEPGSSGVYTIDHFVRNVLMGYQVSGERSTGNKMDRAKPLSSQAEAGNVYLVRGAWNKEYLQELHGFPQAGRDDQVDASSGAFKHIAGAGASWDKKFQERNNKVKETTFGKKDF